MASETNRIATSQSIMASVGAVDLNKARFVRDVGMATITVKAYKSALSLFDHFLVNVLCESKLADMELDELDADAEDILRGYSLWLRDTNIPKNHAGARDKGEVTATYMAYSGLKEYLSKTIQVLKDLLPDNQFLSDDNEIELISGVQFEKGCKRSQMRKSDTFGVESKIGLYRIARYGPDVTGTPHWTFLINCDTICKNMMNETKIDDTYNNLTGKRLALVLNKHAVGRGSEFSDLQFKKMHFDPFLDCLGTTWIDRKTVRDYATPFVPNKEGYATDVFHAMGCHFACGRGLFKTSSDLNAEYLFPNQKKMTGSGPAGWLTKAIRRFLPDQVPLEQRNSVSSVSMRIASITEMAAGNVSYWESNARSGHVLPTNQEKYWDRNDPFSSFSAAKCLAGWDDIKSKVSLPNLKWLEVPESTIDKLIGSLITNTVDEFKPNGSLRQILRACVASLIMYDQDVVCDFRRANKNGVQFVHAKLRQAFINTSTFDPRAITDLPNATNDMKAIATLNYWGEILRNKFRDSNQDFQPLSGTSNNETVISALNKISGVCADIARENRELRHEVNALTATVESDRMQFNEMKQQMESMAKTQTKMFHMLRRYTRLYNIPVSPQQHALNPDSGTHLPPPFVLTSTPAVAAMAAPPSAAIMVPMAAPQSATTSAPVSHLDVETTESPADAATSAGCTISSGTGIEHSTASTTTTAPVNCNNTIVENFKYQRQSSGGTSIESIIVDAYYNCHFRHGGGWSFTTIKKGDRFKDTSKYSRCLELFAVAITDGQKQQLEDANLDATQVLESAMEIAQSAMSKLLELEEKPKSGKETRGYSGVGRRVIALMNDKYKIATRSENTTLAEAISMAKTTTKITDYPQQKRKRP